jgi:hypothetical protein
MALTQQQDFDENETDDDFDEQQEEPIATGYEVMICVPENEMRILFRNQQGEVVSSYICDAADAYQMASKILKGYDRLEGI